MQKKKNLMRLKTRPYYALQGLVHTTGSAGGYDFDLFKKYTNKTARVSTQYAAPKITWRTEAVLRASRRSSSVHTVIGRTVPSLAVYRSET